MARIVVGLSGGVDSSVAAHLLKEQGHEVIGIFMRNWNDSSVVINNECPWIDDSNDALMIAEQLGIPFQVLDLSEEYRERIVDYMFREYEQGRTPNPDILCNREVKFDLFLQAALELGADKVATGHYARISKANDNGSEKDPTHRLLAGKDANKDQSYFLCQLSQEQLARSVFPIGELEKSEVRRIARSLGLVTAEKKDSQGLCFIGKVRLPDFLKEQLAAKKGAIVEVAAGSSLYDEPEEATLAQKARPYVYTKEDGQHIGKHNGAHFFTIGQRKGVNVGGREAPLFVIGTDVQENVLYVGQGEEHPGLYRTALFMQKEQVHWVRPELELAVGEERAFQVRIRYRQPLQNAWLICEPEGLYIRFEEKQKAITAGQFAAWYEGAELIGSGTIHHT